MMPVISIHGLVADFQNAIDILPNNIDAAEAFDKYADTTVLGIEFPSHSDGRGSSLAKRLRRYGFEGKLRAVGPIIPDQFVNLIACGFDEIEISEAQLLRQPLSQWMAAIGRSSHSYQQFESKNLSVKDLKIASKNAP